MKHIFGIVAILFIASSCNERFNKTQVSANLIIEGLERYKEDNGTFPEKLQDLVPSYLKKIPKSAYNNRAFIYEKLDGSYRLIYLGAFGAEATYHSRDRTWTYDD